MFLPPLCACVINTYKTIYTKFKTWLMEGHFEMKLTFSKKVNKKASRNIFLNTYFKIKCWKIQKIMYFIFFIFRRVEHTCTSCICLRPKVSRFWIFPRLSNCSLEIGYLIISWHHVYKNLVHPGYKNWDYYTVTSLVVFTLDV